MSHPRSFDQAHPRSAGRRANPRVGLTLVAALLTVAGLWLSACSKGPSGSEPADQDHGRLMLKLASEYQTNLPVLGPTITRIAARLEVASNGTVRVKIYEPGELVPKLQTLDAVSQGKVDMAFSTAGYWAGKLPASPLFSSVPFGPEMGEYLAWMFQGNGLKLYQQMYDRYDYDVKVLLCGVLAPETSGWFAKPIESADDLRGLKMRFFGLGGRVMEKLGVAVTLYSSAEIFHNLEKGVIDATEYSLPTIDQKLGFHQIVKYNYFPGWHQQATFVELLINRAVWDRLSPSRQALVEMACQEGLVQSIAEGEGTQFTAMRENESQYGVQNKYWSEQMLELFRQAWEQVAVEQCAQDEFFKQVYDDLARFRADYDIWETNAFLPRRGK